MSNLSKFLLGSFCSELSFPFETQSELSSFTEFNFQKQLLVLLISLQLGCRLTNFFTISFCVLRDICLIPFSLVVISVNVDEKIERDHKNVVVLSIASLGHAALVFVNKRPVGNHALLRFLDFKNFAVLGCSESYIIYLSSNIDAGIYL